MHVIVSDHLVNTSEAFRPLYIVREGLANNKKSTPVHGRTDRHPSEYAPRNNTQDVSVNLSHRCKIGLRNQAPSETDTTISNTHYLSRYRLLSVHVDTPS